MNKIINWIFRKRKDKLNKSNDNIFYLSMHIDRNNSEHVDKMNLFIKLLNERNINWNSFISQPTLLTIGDKQRFEHFNVCVEMKFKNELEQIHRDVYGWY